MIVAWQDLDQLAMTDETVSSQLFSSMLECRPN